MSSRPIEHLHPVVEFVEGLGAGLDDLAEVPVMSMSAQDKCQVLVELARARAQLEALTLRMLAEAEQSEATVASGAASAADWVAIETRQVRRDARSDLKLAQRLGRHELVAAGMATGRVNTAQARAIVASLERLPRTGEFAIGTEQRTAAETHLVALAEHHDARELRVLGRRILEVIAPDLAEEFEGRALEAEEAKALRRTTLVMWEDDQGTTHGRFDIPTAQGQMLTKMILSLSNPARSTATDIDDDLPTPVRHGLAFCQLIEAVPATSLPKAGGCSATVVVTMTLEQLLGRLGDAGVCTLDTGGHISASQARRLACSAGIIPMVLGGKSQVLDVGRRRRLHTEAMRLVMGVRDGGCTAEHCETPPGLCHAHHDIPWSRGGPTNVDTGRLLCPHHHRRMHDPGFRVRRLPSGKIRFHRRE